MGWLVVVVRAAFLVLFLQLLSCFPTFEHFLGLNALADAGIPYSEVKQACVGYVYGK